MCRCALGLKQEWATPDPAMFLDGSWREKVDPSKLNWRTKWGTHSRNEAPNLCYSTMFLYCVADSGSANRYEAPFSVSYDTDINLIPDIVEKAVAGHADVLDLPYPPDCELRGFGDSGIDFAVEFWVNGFDDGPNKYTSDVLFLIWNALKDHSIEIPFPQRVVELKGEIRTTAT